MKTRGSVSRRRQNAAHKMLVIGADGTLSLFLKPRERAQALTARYAVAIRTVNREIMAKAKEAN